MLQRPCGRQRAACRSGSSLLCGSRGLYSGSRLGGRRLYLLSISPVHLAYFRGSFCFCSHFWSREGRRRGSGAGWSLGTVRSLSTADPRDPAELVAGGWRGRGQLVVSVESKQERAFPGASRKLPAAPVTHAHSESSEETWSGSWEQTAGAEVQSWPF